MRLIWAAPTLLSLLCLSSCEHLELSADDFKVDVTFSITKGNRYALEFIIESYLEDTQRYQLDIMLLDVEGEELESTTHYKRAGGPHWPEWKLRYRSDQIEPGQTVKFYIIVRQNGQLYKSKLKEFEVPEQSGRVDITDISDDYIAPSTTIAPESITLKTFEITRRPSTSTLADEESAERGGRRRKPLRRRPPPPEKGKEERLNITLIVVCTVVPIVVMVGLVVIVLIIIRYRRRHHSSSPPPPYELTGHNTYNGGRSTIGSNASHGKLPPLNHAGSMPPSMPMPDPYTYAGEVYEEIPAAEDSLAKRPLPTIDQPKPQDTPTDPMRYTASRPECPPLLDSEDSVYIDPDMGLPESEVSPPRSPNYQRPLPQEPTETGDRIYLSLRRQYSDAYEP